MLTLVLLQIISMTWLLAMLEVTLSLKQVTNFWFSREAVQAADVLLQAVEAKSILKLPVCMVNTMPVAAISAKPDSWWRENACMSTSDYAEYYYVIEALGVDACAVLNGSTAEYYRMTLLSIPKGLKGIKILLQSTLAKPAPETVICNDNPHYVKLGRQMVREI